MFIILALSLNVSIKNQQVVIEFPGDVYSFKKRKPAQGRLGRQGGGS
ncbi:hypothetical protein [Edwardsiella ictaluri]|uniref:Uncharacterized protein n=1 Tax=Edwardsiella ictaluri (strain 93-146) TaxID=634503 RepID=C5BHM8_EDWI9|nr:hypothetical protein [Edwardsiella ictaluri]ACR68372.1 hypothetical protein NT01EI_1164 [Edwardsiella ictaluri 93-146]EKS7763283.1 hypothetical protein [Edwardsiella ictaluri]EKS7770101.1 hypothetical protein [Edwardsiella ictaluri]EKS7773242.1 hypothetical protein [Edwardsiella ictaluri]EKS7776795.1 hypothetical protein [Edwardsiella ictaluri]